MPLETTSGIEDAIDNALNDKQLKVRSSIVMGSQKVSDSKEDIKNVAKKLELKMVVGETRRALDYARTKDSITITGGN